MKLDFLIALENWNGKIIQPHFFQRGLQSLMWIKIFLKSRLVSLLTSVYFLYAAGAVGSTQW